MKSVLPLVCVLLLAACASGQVRPADTKLPAAYDAPTGVAPAELERWWTVFNDAQLNSLVDQALAASPTARTALAVLQEAQATRDANYFGAVLPSGGLGVNGAVNGDLSNSRAQPNSLSAGFSPAWELDLFGRVRAGTRGLDASVQASRFQYEATRTSLIANVAAGLFQARALSAQLAEANETLRIARSQADIARQKVERGLGAGADADSLNANVASAQAQVTILTAQLEGAKRALLVLIGKGTDPRASLEITQALNPAPPAPAAVPGDLLTRRPDVRLAQQQVEIATDRMTVANLAYLPTIRLTPSLSLVATSASTGAVWSIGAGLTQPILDIPKLNAQNRATVAQGEQAVLAYERTIQQAYADAETALINMQADQNALASLTSGEASAHSAYNARQLGYDRGLTDLTTLLQAEQAWRSARLGLITRQAAALQDAINTYKALGGGWNPQAPAQSAAASTTPQGPAQ
ncbi:MAG: efflux system, outer rane lipoprotein NodT family [Caulobacteraceae bacterium]|nr:efflux system, outer rane lipoprotein NodT family [Caulobacteraceae bacterium]